MQKLYKRLGLSLVAVTLAFTLFAPGAEAADFLAPNQESNGSIAVPSKDSHHNLYIAGGTVTIDGPITGDLFAAGGNITVNTDVEQDASVAGGTIILNGAVGGDVRVFGGTVTVNGSVGGDLLMFGGTVTVGEKAAIKGDLVACAGTAVVNGAVAGSVRAYGGSLTLNSAITGAVTVRASEQLVFGPQANVPGQINFTGPKEAVVRDGAQVGAINFHMMERQHGARKAVSGLITLGFVLKLLAWIAAGLVLLSLFRRRGAVLAATLRNSPWSSLGIGFLALIVVPIAAIILALVVVGYYLALLLIIPYVFFLALSCLTAAIFLGALIVKWLMKKPDLQLDWQAVVIGTVAFALIGLIPVVGWLIVAVLSLMAFGSYVRLAYRFARNEQIN